MTAPIEGATSPPPAKGRLVKVALALSLALNVCFVGGLAYSTFVRPTPPLMALGRELDLQPDQRKAFQAFVQVVRGKGAVLRDTNLAIGRKVWDELSQPKPDEQKLSALWTEIANNRRDYQSGGRYGDAAVPRNSQRRAARALHRDRQAPPGRRGQPDAPASADPEIV